MQCKICKRETDYLTVNDEPICLECANKNKYIVCVRCGKLFFEKFLTNNDGLCPSCIEKE